MAIRSVILDDEDTDGGVSVDIKDFQDRDKDLEDVGPDPFRKSSSLKLTEDQKRVKKAWGDTSFREDVAKERAELDQIYGDDSDAWNDAWHGPRHPHRRFGEDSRQAYGVCKVSEDGRDWLDREERERNQDEAGQWLTRTDPDYKRNKVEALVRQAVEKHGLTLRNVQAAFDIGRMTEARAALRSRVRVALFWVWEQESRTTVATVLGVSKQSLYRLMGKGGQS